MTAKTVTNAGFERPVAQAGFGSALVEGFRRWVAYRDTVSALRQLSRRELDDIGVDTGIEEFARRVVNGERAL